ncbi:MAG: M20/M25/M40 family metallo-hydrolase [Dehalococcoidia bacterium]|nr:M20/M25/M40 family metallo-hydrolase [Dehalococcoidia bacterium]
MLLQGHIDVVPADPERWQHPPFGGDLVDGFFFGDGVPGIAALFNPRFTASTLRLMGAKGRTLSPLFRNTATPTSVRGGDRILPNLSPELLMSELRGIAGPDSEIEVLSHDSGLQRPDLGLFETLSDVLKESDPDGIPVPMPMPGATDGRLFARLGIQTYGLLPRLLRETLDFVATIHGPDERVPVAKINFGASAITACSKGMDAPCSPAWAMPESV